jgi:hypothetical protein
MHACCAYTADTGKSSTSTHTFIHEHAYTRTHARAWMQTHTCAPIRVSPDGAPGNDVDCRNAVQARAAPVAHAESSWLFPNWPGNVHNAPGLKHCA